MKRADISPIKRNPWQTEPEQLGQISNEGTPISIIRTLGKIEIFMHLLQEEKIRPNEYYKMVQSAKTKQRKRASRSNKKRMGQQVPEW